VNKIYIASFYDTRDRLRPIIGLLESWGYTVTSRWIRYQEDVKPAEEDLGKYAQRDFDDIDDADILVLDTLDETPRGGREVELGYAIGKKEIMIVGPKRNVFHRLFVTYKDWPSLLLVLWKRAPALQAAMPPRAQANVPEHNG